MDFFILRTYFIFIFYRSKAKLVQPDATSNGIREVVNAEVEIVSEPLGLASFSLKADDFLAGLSLILISNHAYLCSNMKSTIHFTGSEFEVFKGQFSQSRISNSIDEVFYVNVRKIVTFAFEGKDGVRSQPDVTVHARSKMHAKEWKIRVGHGIYVSCRMF